MKKTTKKLAVGAGIGAFVLALIAAASGTAKAAPAQTPPGAPPAPPEPKPPETPPPGPGTPGQPPPGTPGTPGKPPHGPDDISGKLPAPSNTAVNARVVIWTWKQDSELPAGGWVQLFNQDVPFPVDPSAVDLAMFSQLYPPYQAVIDQSKGPFMCAQLYTRVPYAPNGWKLSSPGTFCNYDNKDYVARRGLEWSWVRVYRWNGSGWDVYSDTGAQQSGVAAAKLASAIKDVAAPPYYYSFAFRWNGSAWVLAASSPNY